jgi:hypothetical protein
MKQRSLALLILLVLSAATYSQSVSSAKARSLELTTDTASCEDRVFAARAISALKRLEDEVIIYHSLGDFEAGGKLAQVPFETFQNDLQKVTWEVESPLSQIANDRLKTELSNTLASFRDGAFWWKRIYQPRVVHVSALNYDEIAHSPADAVLLETAPYTVAIYWRQAAKYLKRAEQLQNREQ